MAADSIDETTLTHPCAGGSARWWFPAACDSRRLERPCAETCTPIASNPAPLPYERARARPQACNWMVLRRFDSALRSVATRDIFSFLCFSADRKMATLSSLINFASSKFIPKRSSPLL